jgi:hypothetical protein
MQRPMVLLVLAAPLMIYVGCKQEESPPPQSPSPYPQQPYPQPTQTAPAPAPAPAPTPAPTVAPAPGQPAPAGTMSQPSPMALPCTADANCLTHRCNTQFGKCAWPCQSDNDCNPGNRCNGGACLPATQ